jgi:mRNA-degrading endonuclease RelE of RelBE toxin-antitoxin system
MSYSVEWHPNTRKILRKLPKDISERIVLKIKELQEDPFDFWSIMKASIITS